MTKTTHATVGIYSSYYLSVASGINPTLPVVVGVLSSLLPDIDTGKSMINKLLIRFKFFRSKWMKGYYALLSMAFYEGYYFTGLKLLGLFSVLSLLLVIGEHRTWFHSLLMLIPVAVIMSLMNLNSNLVVIGLINNTLHLFLDMLNPSGVMLLYPINTKVFRFPVTFRSTSVTTRLIEYSADAVLLYITFNQYIVCLM